MQPQYIWTKTASLCRQLIELWRSHSLTQHPQNGLSRVVGSVRLAEAVPPRDEQPHARVQNHQDHHRQQEKHHAARFVEREIVRHVEHAAERGLVYQAA
jgi:hypothetical protein